MPAPGIGKIQTNWDTQDLAPGKGHLHKTHYPSALIDSKEISHNSKCDGTNDTSKQASNDSGTKQHPEARGQCTAQRTRNKSKIEEKQQFFTVKFISESSCENTRG